MIAYARLVNERISEGRITIPSWGAAHADLVVEREATFAASGLELTVADLTMRCATWRWGAHQGTTRLRVIAGYGGWSKRLAPKYYRATAGVKLSLVLGDAARECGEQISVTSDATIGPSYTRELAPAQRLLNRLASTWWVRSDGVTVIGARTPTTSIASTFELIGFDPAKGSALVGAEKLADWTPGRTFTSPRAPGRTFAIDAVEHTFSGSAVRTEVYLA